MLIEVVRAMMKLSGLSCSGSCAQYTGAVMLVIRLSRLLKLGIPFTAVCTIVSAWLNGISLFQSPRGITDDSRALGSPSQMDFALARAGW